MGDPMEDGDRARTVADRAADGEPEKTEEELFPAGSLVGDSITPQTLVKKGLPVELKVSLTRAEVPIKDGGLFDPNKYTRALVTVLPGPATETPKRDDRNDGAKVTGWKIAQELRVTYVTPADDAGALVLAEFEALLATEPERAAELAEKIVGLTAEALGKPVGAAA